MSGDDKAPKKQAEIDEAASDALEQAHRDQTTRELMEELESEASAELEQSPELSEAQQAEQAAIENASAELEQAHLDQEAREARAAQEAAENRTNWRRARASARARGSRHRGINRACRRSRGRSE